LKPAQAGLVFNVKANFGRFRLCFNLKDYLFVLDSVLFKWKIKFKLMFFIYFFSQTNAIPTVILFRQLGKRDDSRSVATKIRIPTGLHTNQYKLLNRGKWLTNFWLEIA
jgi:hypothetical protein